MTHYFNEFDAGKAEWLRELMQASVIDTGTVDERSIEDVTPDEIRRFDCVHLFAGIGIWSYALRLAGFNQPCWTCSCPCQPFSEAGKGEGFADERHLWPAALHLISLCNPGVVFGEQVASHDGLAWLDLVQADLEAVGYTVGAIVTPAAGYGAPHGRHRLYWVAHTTSKHGCYVDNPIDDRRGACGNHHREHDWQQLTPTIATGVLGDTKSPRPQGEWCLSGTQGGRRCRLVGLSGESILRGFWTDSEWLHCRPEPDYPEGRWRPVEPGTFPLAHGAAARVLRLRGYGDGIVATQAAAFIEACKAELLMETSHE